MLGPCGHYKGISVGVAILLTTWWHYNGEESVWSEFFIASLV
jgi:hypothetical protein